MSSSENQNKNNQKYRPQVKKSNSNSLKKKIHIPRVYTTSVYDENFRRKCEKPLNFDAKSDAFLKTSYFWQNTRNSKTRMSKALIDCDQAVDSKSRAKSIAYQIRQFHKLKISNRKSSQNPKKNYLKKRSKPESKKKPRVHSIFVNHRFLI